MEKTEKMSAISMLRKYFGFASAKEFKDEWTQLTLEDKDELKRLIVELFPDGKVTE